MISINTNPAASAAAYSLDNISRNLQKTLTRLSSGSKIVTPGDDAAGMAVSMRLNAAMRRTEATQTNVSNAQSFLETQDGVLKAAEKVINRLGELTQLATDVTKSTSDLALYQTEVDSLKKQINSMLQEAFNGVSLFSTNGATSASVSTSVTGAFNIIASQDGSQTIGISKADFGALFGLICGTASGSGTPLGNATLGASYQGTSSVGLNIATTTSQAGFQTTAQLGTSSIAIINSAIQAIATLRASNGAEQSRLGFAADVLSINKTNLESAAARITEVDIAEESAKLARFSILQQAGTAMLAQANQSTGSILRLLS
jgi:flagellin